MGLDTTPTARKNITSQVSRVKAFVQYMGHSQGRLFEWTFLNNRKRIKT